MDYSRFFSEDAKRRDHDPASMYGREILFQKDCYDLAGGLFNPNMFPITDITATLRNGDKVNIDGDLLKRALQYGPSAGFPNTRAMCKEFLQKLHNPPTFKEGKKDGLEFLATSGNEDGINLAYETILNAGDNVLIENTAFTMIIKSAMGLGLNMLAVDVDKDGPIPGSMKKLLSKWKPADGKNPKSDIPKLFVTNPTGQNPTGFTASAERRKEVYKLAQEYNFLILEDDPYFLIEFSGKSVPSYLSMDVDGRVIRCDSFSKIFATGLRFGIISGPKPIIDKAKYKLSCSRLQISSLIQVLITAIYEKMGFDGLLKYVKELSVFYKSQRDFALQSLDKHMKEYADWDIPISGYFIWLKLKNPRLNFSEELYTKCIAKKVSVLPGEIFMVKRVAPSPFIRICFSKSTTDIIDKAIGLLAETIKEEIKNLK